MGTEGRPDDHTPTLPGEERYWPKGDRQPAGVGSASAEVGSRECHMWRLPEQEAEGEILLFLREGMGTHLRLRCCCLKSWWFISSVSSCSGFKEEVH